MTSLMAKNTNKITLNHHLKSLNRNDPMEETRWWELSISDHSNNKVVDSLTIKSIQLNTTGLFLCHLPLCTSSSGLQMSIFFSLQFCSVYLIFHHLIHLLRLYLLHLCLFSHLSGKALKTTQKQNKMQKQITLKHFKSEETLGNNRKPLGRIYKLGIIS